MPEPLLNSAYSKLSRASEHVTTVKSIIEEGKPFSYLLATDTKMRQRWTYARSNQEVVDHLATVCGDVIQNLRAALDHAYWEIVSPHVTHPRMVRSIQFPFAASAEKVQEQLEARSAHALGQGFVDLLNEMRPYGGTGGNRWLQAVHELGVNDRHKLLTPLGDYKTISSTDIREQIPDFPAMIVNCSFGGNAKDIMWSYTPPPVQKIGKRRPLSDHIYEKELDVNVEVLLTDGLGDTVGPLLPSLVEARNEIKNILSNLRNYAAKE